MGGTSARRAWLFAYTLVVAIAAAAADADGAEEVVQRVAGQEPGASPREADLSVGGLANAEMV